MIVFLRRALVGWSRLNSSIFGNGRFSSSKVFHFPEEGGDPGTGPGKLHSGEPGFLLAGNLGTGVPSSGDPKAGVVPGAGHRSNNPAIPGSTQARTVFLTRGMISFPYVRPGSGAGWTADFSSRTGSTGLLMMSWRRWSLEL
ncbi:hypothetical protein F2Q69_00042522 [Brassica cretica]|uniref:Uncharacterized protein n=1 Tax=Brassica cretica TaxID=69181 RepID=A0A8S9NKR1_BRACR|nr:hypothetical protein F2Q69_00042522 [Brassica cretica]